MASEIATTGATVTLISETRGTRLPEVITRSNGDFVVPNVTADRYTVQITMDGFKTLQRTGISVSAGDRQGLGTFIIELGGVSETVSVKSEAPTIQSQKAVGIILFLPAAATSFLLMLGYPHYRFWAYSTNLAVLLVLLALVLAGVGMYLLWRLRMGPMNNVTANPG